jgi:hypothetical protein
MIKESVWSAADDRPHPECKQEWWSTEAFLTDTAGNRWSLRAYIWEYVERKRPETFLIMTVLNERTGEHYTYTSREARRIHVDGERLDVRCGASRIEGLYPVYSMVFQDPQHRISVALRYEAAAAPAWVADEVTRGWLPLGFGFFRYGFIPRLTVSGSLKIGEKTLSVSGVGYYEHIWGEFSYLKVASVLYNPLKTFSIYSKLIVWWIKHNKHALPRSIVFASENNPIGNDWAWGVLENGWTLFYGNILLWVMEGPAMGTLILTKDGRTYTEFGTLSFRYTKIKHDTTYDFVYPTELEVIARHEGEMLHVFFDMDSGRDEVLDVFSHDDRWTSLVVCENPGRVRGVYRDGDAEVALVGRCKLELQRQLSHRGHNSLRLTFTRLGCSYELVSHYFGKKVSGTVQFLPKPLVRWTMRTISRQDDSGGRTL